MKKKIVIRDSKGRIVKEGEVTLRDEAHFQTQLKFRRQVVESKKVYNRARSKREWA